MSFTLRTLLLPAMVALAACASTEEPAEAEPAKADSTKTIAKPAETTKTVAEPEVTTKSVAEPEYVTVDHILIAFNGAPRMEGVTRSLDEAKELTDTIVAKLKNDGDWLALKKQFSDDPGPTGDGGGPYSMANNGVPERPGSHPRTGMVPAFGNVGFRLAVGEIGVAAYDSRKSPFGYHIIKRVK